MLCVLTAFAALPALPALPRAQAEPPTLPERVNHAVVRGVEWLRGQQRADGTFPGQERHGVGMTALAALALVESGVRRRDPGLQRALAVVEAGELTSVYGHATRLLLCADLGEPERWSGPARESLDFLVDAGIRGAWAYPWGEPDLSNTQFALLGLHAAHRLGLDVPEDTLADAAGVVWRWQDDAGGFRYALGRQPDAGMTAATLGGLEILAELGARTPGVRSALKKRRKDAERARQWLAGRFDVARNHVGPRAWTADFQYGFLWAVERYGALAGVEAIGDTRWYEAGAEWLVDQQEADGRWERGMRPTCFALLFLRKATLSGEKQYFEELEAGIDRAKASELASRVVPDATVPRATDWLVAGPWQGEVGNGLLVDPPFDPARVNDARPKGRVARERWRPATMKPDGWTDLQQLPGCAPGENQLWAVATWLDVEGNEPLDALLWLDLEDGWDVYLDGERRAFGQRIRSRIDGLVRAELALAPGAHLLLVLVEQEAGSVPFGARFTGPDGAPLARELRVTGERPKRRR